MQLLVIVAASLFTPLLCATTFTEQAKTQCKNINVPGWQVSETERAAKRKSSQTPVYISGEQIGQVINQKKYGNAVKGVIAPFVLILILLLFTLISFFVFIAFCCCCRRYNNPTSGKSKASWLMSFVFFVGFTVLFILMIIYLVNTNKQYKDIKCVAARIPADLLEGEVDLNPKFMGFQTLDNQLNALKEEVGNFSAVESDFQDILGRDIDTKTQSAYSALPDFYNKYKGKTTRKGDSTAATPTSVSNLTQVVSDAINAEFSLYVVIGTALNNVADEGNKFVQSNSEQQIKDALDQILNFLNTLITPLQKQMTSINNAMNKGSNALPIGTYVALGIGILIFFLSAVFMVVLCCRFQKQRCLRGSCCLKTVLIVLSFLAILLTLISILLLLTTTGVSTLCRFTGDLLQSSQSSTVLAKYNITFKDQTISDAIDRCVSAGATGDIASLVSADPSSAAFIQNISDFLDGLTNYEKQLDTVDSGSLDSTTVVAQTGVWNDIKVGITFDQGDIASTLANLNNLVSCAGTKYVLNASACSSSDNDCRVIPSTTFTAPSCSSDSTTASTNFSNLKNYYNDENTLLGDMITDLGSTSADSANNRFRTAKQAMRDSKTNFENITGQLTNTLAAVSNFTDDFSTLTDCRIIRTELENFETVFCFQTGKHIYLFFCFTVFAAFCLFVLTWFLCGTMRCIAHQDGGDVYPRNDDMYQPNNKKGYFNDEKVPL